MLRKSDERKIKFIIETFGVNGGEPLTPLKAAEKRHFTMTWRNLNLRRNGTEKRPVRAAENHNSRIKEAFEARNGKRP